MNKHAGTAVSSSVPSCCAYDDAVSDLSFAYKGRKAADQAKNTAYLKVRERYLRSDIDCGVVRCPVCCKRRRANNVNFTSGSATSATDIKSPRLIGSRGTICFVTLDVLLFYVPLLEYTTTQFRDFVILQSDYRAFKKLASGSQQKQLRLFIQRTDITVHFFANEHHTHSAVTGQESMAFRQQLSSATPADDTATTTKTDDAANNELVNVFCGDRCALFKAVGWFVDHTRGIRWSQDNDEEALKVILLHHSDVYAKELLHHRDSPQSNLQTIVAMRLDNSFVKRFCCTVPNDINPGVEVHSHNRLQGADVTVALDLLQSLKVQQQTSIEKMRASRGREASGGGEDDTLIFTREPDVGMDEILRRVKAGRYTKGTLEVKMRKTWQAYVRVAGQTQQNNNGRDVFVPSRELQNRALHGDVVAVEELSSEKWVSDAKDVYASEAAWESSAGKTGTIPTGRVVAVLRRNPRHYVATILEHKDPVAASQDGSHALAVPLNPRLPKIRIRTSQATALIGHRLVVVIDGWDGSSTYPDGHYVDDLGPCGLLDTELRALMVDKQMTTHLQPHSAEGVAAVANWADYNRRRKIAPLAANDSPSAGTAKGGSSDDSYLTHDIAETKLFEANDRVDLRPAVRVTSTANATETRSPFFVLSVDPNGCTDIDDAMSIQRVVHSTGKVTFELGVHIADVTRLVVFSA